MKKVICLLLSIMLLFQMTTIAFAQTQGGMTTNNAKIISIPLASTSIDIEAMSKLGLDKFVNEPLAKNATTKVEAIKGTLNLHFDQFIVQEDKVIATGSCITTILGAKNEYLFSNCELSVIKLPNNHKIYTGVLESSTVIKEQEVPVLIDVVGDVSLENVVVSISIGTLEADHTVLFFGEIFEDYTLYVNQYYNNTNLEQQNTDIVTDTMDGTRSVPSDEKYVYCGLSTNNKIGSNTASGETVIVTAGKRDFRDRDAYTGFEIIRVFSRSNNARAAVSGATSAVPYKAIIEFECTTKDYLEVVNTYPSPSSISLPQFVGLYSTLNSTIAFAEVATNLILNSFSSVSRTIGSTNSTGEDNYTKVTIDINPTNASNTDLPSGSNSSSAKTNTVNGAMCKIKYDSMGNDSVYNGYATASGNIQYRVYIGTNHRISTLTTGSAALTHSVFNR